MARKFLVVGKNGFIAKAFSAVADKLNVTYTTSRQNQDDAIYLDLTKPECFDYSIIDEDTMVVLLAANSSPDACLNDYVSSYQLNVVGTSVFIKNCLEKKAKILFFSSDTVYGDTEKEVYEDSELNPVGEYAKMKAEVEHEFLEDQNFKVFRLSYVFSEHDKFMQYILGCIRDDEIAEVFEPLDRAVVYLQDVIDGIFAISNNWNIFTPSIVNLAGPEVMSRAKIVEYINENFPGRLKYKVLTPSEEFYKARPRIINMKSLYLSKLLGREPLSIKEAIKLELEETAK